MQLLNCHEMHHDSSILDRFLYSAISLDEAALTLVCSKLVTRNTHTTDYHIIYRKPFTCKCHIPGSLL
jgi:hypothetical protein